MSYERINFTDGQLLTAEQLNHIEEGIVGAESTGGGGVSSWNDLTDKPFGSEYTEAEPVVCVEDSEISVNRAGSMSFYAKGSVSVDFAEIGVVPNELGTIKVVFDGTEYTLTSCGAITYGGKVSGFGYGNSSLITNAYSGQLSDSSDTGELLGIVLESNAVYLCMDDDYIGTHTISMTYYDRTETITLVPTKYIPSPSISPIYIEVDTLNDIFEVGNDVFDDLPTFVAKVKACFNNGHKLYGEIFNRGEETFFSLNITDAIYNKNDDAILANAVGVYDHTQHSVYVDAYSIIVYKPDGTEEYRKDYAEE